MGLLTTCLNAWGSFHIDLLGSEFGFAKKHSLLCKEYTFYSILFPGPKEAVATNDIQKLTSTILTQLNPSHRIKYFMKHQTYVEEYTAFVFSAFIHLLIC